MPWIVLNIRWIMLVSGALTATMIYAAIAPEAALRSTFGETLSGPLAQVVVRNWGALVALVGGMLIYGAFDPPGRPLILTVAGVSKAVFIGLVLSQGSRYLAAQAGIAIAIDLVMVALFAWYIVAVRKPETRMSRSPVLRFSSCGVADRYVDRPLEPAAAVSAV